MLLAHVLQWPDFALTEPEASQLSTATANVLRHFDIGGTARTFDYLNLAQCVAVIYGSKIYARVQERKAQAAKTVIPTESVGLKPQ